MRTSFMQRSVGPDANLAFQTIKAQYGMRQFMRIPIPASAGNGTGPTTFAWDILQWECHLDPNDKRHKQSHIYHEKINLWWSVPYRQFIEKAFTKMHGADGVCAAVQVEEEKDTWLFFGWYDEDVKEAEIEQRSAA